MSGEDVTPESKPPNGDVAETASPNEPAKAVARKNANEEIDDFGLPVKRTLRRKTLEEEEEARVLANGTLEMTNGSPAENPNAEGGEKNRDQKENSKGEPKDEFTTPRETPTPDPPTPEPAHIPRQRSTSRASRHSSVERTRARSRASTLERQIKERSRSHSSKRNSMLRPADENRHSIHNAPSEWSHQQLAPQLEHQEDESDHEDKWEEMPAYAPFDIYNDDGKLVAREHDESGDEMVAYGTLGGAGKGYTRVQLDEDAQSATSMDDNTAYLFKEHGTNVQDEDDEARDALTQLQTTKGLLTEGQKIAYVGLVRLAMIEMLHNTEELERTRGTKKAIDFSTENMKMWSQKMMVRVYSHMEIPSAEQIMIEQLAEHGIQPGDLAPQLKINARVKNPGRNSISSGRPSISSPQPSLSSPRPPSPSKSPLNLPVPDTPGSQPSSPFTPNEPLPPYEEHTGEDLPAARTPSQLPNTQTIDVDIRWTILCDLFLVLIADSLYDARSRRLLEIVGSYLDVPWLDICRFEKRVTDALEMQEAADKENWNEDEHMEHRRKMARNRRLMMMGIATVGGGLVIGLSAGLLAPVIGAGLAAGFTTIGVAGTSGFLAGAGGAAIITTTGIVTGGAVAVKASHRRTGAVKTFEYRPLHNNKRVNLIITVSGWMTGKVDDVRLPFSTIDPIMGDIYSVHWEPEMLQSMGQTINILATEALTQGLQQVLGSTVLIGLMAALQLPIVLTKLAYLIDNPWSVSVTRADAAGLILADSLTDQNLGSRPVTLVGFSIGARVIFACLRELANKGQCGLVQNVYLFGTPVVANKDEYIKCRTVVSGRFVNAYATNDWILGYLFRATSGAITRVAGLAPIELPGIENVNCTEFVPGHMSYRTVMPRLLREAGWAVESDEFTEIEDPDPDNHEKRQRELINEIEEARKQLQEQPEKKKRFAFFSKKKLAEKKEWETYDERMKEMEDEKAREDKDGNVLFDIEAIRKEVAAIAAEGITIRELESTLPPMKLEISNEPAPLRQTKSHSDVSDISTNGGEKDLSAPPPRKPREDRIPEQDLDAHNHGGLSGGVAMSFDAEYDVPSSATLAKSTFSSSIGSPPPPVLDRDKREPSPSYPRPPLAEDVRDPPSYQRPPLTHAQTVAPIVSLQHNVWADEEEEFGRESEVGMTFE